MEQDHKSPRLTAAEYWEWRTTIAEMQVAEARYKCTELEVKLLYKEAEVLAVKTQLHRKGAVEGAKTRLGEAQAEYARIKEALEGHLGVSLNKKIIDDVTYEVRDLPEEAPTQPMNH